MKTAWPRVLLALAIFCLCAGCKREAGPPPPLAVDQIPIAFEKAFKSAPPDLKDLAAKVSIAVQTNDYPAAFAAVQALSATPGATAEQSRLAARAMMTINDLLQTAETKGDEIAAETLKIYKATK
jgi:hypothetical protein